MPNNNNNKQEVFKVLAFDAFIKACKPQGGNMSFEKEYAMVSLTKGEDLICVATISSTECICMRWDARRKAKLISVCAYKDCGMLSTDINNAHKVHYIEVAGIAPAGMSLGIPTKVYPMHMPTWRIPASSALGISIKDVPEDLCEMLEDWDFCVARHYIPECIATKYIK